MHARLPGLSREAGVVSFLGQARGPRVRAPEGPRDKVRLRAMSVRRPPTARAVPFVWLLLGGCTFEAFGLGSTQDAGTGFTTGDGATSTGTSEPTTAASSETTDAADTTDTGEACPDGCPPTIGWTAVADRVGYALALDPAGDVLVAGDRAQLDDELLRDVWLARFGGADGQLRWEQRYDGAGRRSDFARAVVVLGDGRIVAGGGSQEVQARRQDVWVGWYDAAGMRLQTGDLGTAKWDGENVQLDESVRTLALGADGELIAGGTRCQAPCVVPDAWLGRFDHEGLALWTEPMLVTGPGALRAVAALAGGMLGAGTDGYTEAKAPWRSQIRSFDASGAGSWSALQEPPGASSFEALGVAVAPGGELWVVGRELDGELVTGGFVRLYRPDHDFMPVVERRGEALGGEASAVVVAADGGVVVTGTAGHLWLGRFDGELEPVWRIEEPAGAVDSGRALAQDAHGVIVLGQILGGDGLPIGTWLRRYLYQA